MWYTCFNAQHIQQPVVCTKTAKSIMLISKRYVFLTTFYWSVSRFFYHEQFCLMHMYVVCVCVCDRAYKGVSSHL